MRVLSTKLPPINAEHLDKKQFPHQIASYIAFEALNLIAPRPNSAIKVVWGTFFNRFIAYLNFQELKQCFKYVISFFGGCGLILHGLRMWWHVRLTWHNFDQLFLSLLRRFSFSFVWVNHVRITCTTFDAVSIVLVCLIAIDKEFLFFIQAYEQIWRVIDTLLRNGDLHMSVTFCVFL